MSRPWAVLLTAALLAWARPAEAQVQTTVQYGYAHCSDVDSLIVVEMALRMFGPQAFIDAVASTPRCELSDGLLVMTARPAGPGGEPLMWEGDEILCLESPLWNSCRYALRRSAN